MPDLSKFSIGRAVSGKRDDLASGVDWGHVTGFSQDPDTYAYLIDVTWSDGTATSEEPEGLT